MCCVVRNWSKGIRIDTTPLLESVLNWLSNPFTISVHDLDAYQIYFLFYLHCIMDIQSNCYCRIKLEGH